MSGKIALQIQHHYCCDEMLTAAAECGFKYISLGFGSSRHFERSAYMGEIVRLRKLLDSLGLTCVMTHAPYYDLRISAEILDPDMEDALLRCVEATSMLGAEIMAVHPRACYENGKENVKASFSANVKNFLPLVKYASVCGVKIGIENLPVFPGWDLTFFSNFPESHKDLIDYYASDNVCGVWDFGHSHLANGRESASVLKKFGNRIQGTHVHDNMGDNDSHLTPFMGNIDWSSEMSALSSFRYSGYLTMELDYSEELARNYNEVRSFIRNAYVACSRLDNMLNG